VNELLAAMSMRPDKINELEPESIPVLMAELAALLNALAARWLSAGIPADPRAAGRDEDRLLTVPEAAGRLAFSPNYLYELIRQKQFPSVRAGKYVRVRERDISSWIDEHRVSAVDMPVYSTYNNDNDRRRTAAHPKKDGAYASRIRGPRRRRAELDCAPGAGRNGDPRAPGQAHPHPGRTQGSPSQAQETQEVAHGNCEDR